MSKKQRSKPRAFRPEFLDAFAGVGLVPRMGPGETLWRYTVTVPLEEIRPQKRQRATQDDVRSLHEMCVRHFGGYTRLPNSPGYGLRDPNRPEKLAEMNYNAYFSVLT